MQTLGQDISFALRVLRKSPGFTAVAIVTLALGIGANTAIFTLLDGLALRDLNVPHPEQLTRFGAQPEGETYTGLSVPMLEQIEAEQKVFTAVFAWSSDYLSTVEINGSLSRHDIWAVTGNFYSELGGTPELGRLIGPQDDDLKAASPNTVAVLAYDFWQRQYGGDRHVIGRTLKIEGAPFTVIGVTPPGFTGVSADRSPEITIPLNAEPLLDGENDTQKQLRRADLLFLDAAGRLKNGITIETARAQLESIWPGIRYSLVPTDLQAAARSQFLKLHLKIDPGDKGSSALRSQFTKPLYILLAISGLVLLVTCINVATLMLSRTSARSHEIAVRVALGASRTRLLRQALTESVMLSVVGTLAGILLAYWWSRSLAGFILSQFFNAPARLNLSPDIRVLLCTVMIAIGTGVLFGVAPAWRSTREDPNVALQSNAKKFTSGTGRLGRGLIIAQIALSLVVLAVAGLFIRTLTQLRVIELGYEPRGVLDVSLYPQPGGYKNLDFVHYYQELTNRVSRLPGVESAGIAKMSLGWRAWKEDVRSSQDTVGALSKIDVALVMPGFFKTVRIDVEQGRSFSWQDDGNAPRVAIVSRSLARRLYGNSDPIGQHIEITSEPEWQKAEIVGVVSDASLYDIRRHAPPALYLALTQYGRLMGGSQLMLRTRTAPASSARVVRETVESLGHEYVAKTHLIEETIDRSILRERLFAILSGFFGGLALLLAAVGLYGLMAYNVTRRTREIGVRMALGATRRDVLSMVLRESLSMTAIGLLLGIAAALGSSHSVSNLIYGVSARDPVSLAAVCVLLAVVASLAGMLPAWKAMKVDPMVALRNE